MVYAVSQFSMDAFHIVSPRNTLVAHSCVTHLLQNVFTLQMLQTDFLIVTFLPFLHGSPDVGQPCQSGVLSIVG